MVELRIIENGLMPVYENEVKEQLVSGTDIYNWLEISKDKSSWFKDQNESLDFIENLDFVLNPLKGENSKGRPSIDYIYTIDAAKHICMASRSQKGKTARQYFISIEKKYKELTSNPLLSMSKSDVIEKWLEDLKAKEAQQQVIEKQQKFIETVKPKLEIYDQFIASNTDVTIEEFAKMTKFTDSKSRLIGRNKMFELLRDLKILQSNNKPYQDYMNYFNVKQKPIWMGDSTGYQNIIVPLVTPKGQEWLYKKLKSKFGLKEIA